MGKKTEEVKQLCGKSNTSQYPELKCQNKCCLTLLDQLNHTNIKPCLHLSKVSCDMLTSEQTITPTCELSHVCHSTANNIYRVNHSSEETNSCHVYFHGHTTTHHFTHCCTHMCTTLCTEYSAQLIQQYSSQATTQMENQDEKLVSGFSNLFQTFKFKYLEMHFIVKPVKNSDLKMKSAVYI